MTEKIYLQLAAPTEEDFRSSDRRIQDARHGDVELAAQEVAEQVTGQVPGGNCNDQAEDQDQSDVGAQQAGGSHGAGVRRHKNVHHGERGGSRETVGQQ